MKLKKKIVFLITFFLTCASMSMAQTDTLVLFSDNTEATIIKGVNRGQPIGTLPIPNKSGFTFKYWQITSASPASLVGTIISAATIWTYETTPVVATAKYDVAIKGSVIFNSNGGSAVSSIENIELNQLVSKPADPTKSGSFFMGWYKESSLTTLWDFSSDKVTGSVALYAKWISAIGTVTVTFDSNAGSNIATKTMNVGELLPEPTPPTKSGSIFMGWYKESTFNIRWNFSTDKVFETMTLYAKWIAENTQFSVIFLDGTTTLKNYLINVNSLITDIPAAPVKSGFAFGGWQEFGQSIVWDFAENRVTDHVVFQPKWVDPTTAVTVTFNSNGGSPVAPQTITANQLATQPIPPTKENYTFGGWYQEISLTTPWTFNTDKVTSNITLYAKWVNLTIQFTITFDSNGGSPVAPQTVTGDQLATQPTPPTKENYTFGGWYQEISLTTPWTFNTDKVTSNITLYAKWIDPTIQFTVTFNSNDGSPVAPQIVIGDQLATQPTPPTKENFIFGGWYQEISFTTPWTFNTDKVTSDITLYAKWVDPTDKFTVTFESNGGTGVPEITDITAGSTIEKPADPTLNNFIFGGWYQETSFTTPWNFSTDQVTSNITLYAKWVDPTDKFTVTFESNGGTGVPEITDITAGSTIEKPADPTLNNFIFGGWYQETSFTTPWNFSTDQVTSNITLYAKWVSATDKHTVTFETNGGSAVKSVTLKSNALLVRPTNSPTKIGHVFVGWYKEERLASLWIFSKERVTSNITLYAKWSPNKYKVTFNSNRGTNIAAVTVKYNDTLSSPKKPTKAGYAFNGWYKETSLVTAWDFANDVVTKNITLYAKWATPTGITKEDYLLKLYPNPATTEIKIENIEQTEASLIQIFDMTGKPVLQVLVGESIDISALPQGIYSVKAGNYTAKFIKR